MAAVGIVKIAVVLFNLGAPDRPAAVQPFLRNLFGDPAILRVPSLIRPFLARLIAKRRAPEAQKIYEKIGGGSPLLAETRKQADALQSTLDDRGTHKYGVFIAMRYWHPFTAEAASEVKQFGPDRIILLPLYPQHSSTTTGSSVDVWKRIARKQGISVPTYGVCCYPQEPNWIESQVDLLLDGLQVSGRDAGSLRILFSAHGLPKRVVDSGDPYPHQVEQTAKAIIDSISQRIDSPPDWVVCYQSKVGPLEWIGPSTESEIIRAGRDGKSVIIAPISFVSEHSETLVELDMDFRKLAESNGVEGFFRIPTAGIHPRFIAGLVEMVEAAIDRETPLGPAVANRFCLPEWTACPCAVRGAGIPR